MEESASALEQFRQQWKEEVNARSRKTESRTTHTDSLPKARRPSEPRAERTIVKPPSRHPVADLHNDSEPDSKPHQRGITPSGISQGIEGITIKGFDDEDGFSVQESTSAPKTALEHYEKAVERENQGNLGDSVALYRKAYRLDAEVDQTYKEKHFPVKSKPTNVNPSGASATVPSTAHHSSKEPNESITTFDLIQSFADIPISSVPLIIEGDRDPPCPIQKLPTEVMVEMLRHIAIRDPALLVRLSLVCKKLAYHVALENSIWKRVALGSEFGLASQRYTFATDIQGREVIYKTVEEEAGDVLPSVDEAIFPKGTVWRDVFHSFPRIRFSGVYISTVNYTRPGGASATQAVWSNPIHIVTYYRYLRFFRDGTCISLLTTHEPVEVVHHLTCENIKLVRSKGGKEPMHSGNYTSSTSTALHPPQGSKEGSSAALPPSTQQLMKHALRGRWRLCHPQLDSEAAAGHDNAPVMLPGDLHIETEGAGPRYLYTMHLSLKSSSRSKHATRNNKLQWKGYWGYNTLTNDWSEFLLRHDKPFYFSRVRSYGLGY